MLDLDSLAEERARTLNQQEKVWKDAIWSPAFQSLSQKMSDGEVELFLAMFNNVNGFEEAVREIERKGLHPGEWIRSAGRGSV
jgi:hypothetical protein